MNLIDKIGTPSIFYNPLLVLIHNIVVFSSIKFQIEIYITLMIVIKYLKVKII